MSSGKEWQQITNWGKNDGKMTQKDWKDLQMVHREGENYVAGTQNYHKHSRASMVHDEDIRKQQSQSDQRESRMDGNWHKITKNILKMNRKEHIQCCAKVLSQLSFLYIFASKGPDFLSLDQ